jgi:hypothetical protein
MSHKFSTLIIIFALLFVAACSPATTAATPSALQSSMASQTTAKNTPIAESTAVANAAPTEPAMPAQSEPSGTPGLSNRVSDSVNKLLMFEHKLLDSYRIEMSGVEPRIDIMDNTLGELKFERQIEMAGDDLHMISNLEEKGEKATREGYIIGGLNTDTMKDYEIKASKLEDGGGMVGMGFAMFPINVGMPVIMGAQGATLEGEESIAGRTAEKWVLDSAHIPQESLDFTGFKSIKGTAWIDKETGTLLKLVLDYEQEFVDPDPNSDKMLGVGKGKIDLVVSQIGQTKVTLPQ